MTSRSLSTTLPALTAAAFLFLLTGCGLLFKGAVTAGSAGRAVADSVRNPNPFFHLSAAEGEAEIRRWLAPGTPADQAAEKLRSAGISREVVVTSTSLKANGSVALAGTGTRRWFEVSATVSGGRISRINSVTSKDLPL